MKIFFCLSYLNIPTTISLIEEGEEDFRVFTSNKKIEFFFSELYESNKICYFSKPPLPFSARGLISILRLFVKKKIIQSELKKYRHCKVYIFFVSHCFFEAWMVKKLSKYNTIYYDPAVTFKSRKYNNSWKSVLKSYLIRLLYGVSTDPIEYGKKVLYLINKKYLKNVSAQKININFKKKNVNKIINEKLKLNKADILLLIGGTIESGFVSKGNYCLEMDRLLASLNDEGFSIVVKSHPRFNQLYSLEKNQKKIPNYFPANLILKNYEYVIGYSTATLFEAANSGKKSISLLKYFTPNNKKQVEDSVSYLKNNLEEGYSILFPETLSEILEMLSRSSNEENTY
ncbi:hypothetical protein LQ318_09145 [Aliifodinibius salicampi]|uniref:Uncharacterized protein n=1 Tax=Fodinibius salicampi TaxID=1920655 RepID=A0ABT3PYZ9_9BACT|nr:hypothetical protein [Fodinibius salicampi]MCW9713068.1 hypothetical protein [Fodinibius salicampi]